MANDIYRIDIMIHYILRFVKEKISGSPGYSAAREYPSSGDYVSPVPVAYWYNVSYEVHPLLGSLSSDRDCLCPDDIVRAA